MLARLGGRTFASLRHRDYRLYFAGNAVSFVGTWMQQIAAYWLVLDLTGSPLAVGALALVQTLPVTAFALVSMMFLIMVRVTDPLMPRAIFGVLNTLLFFPSGAVYPPQAFPNWMRAIASVDPFTYSVHAFKSLLLKNTGFEAIAGDMLYLVVFSIVAMTLATLLFRRTL